MRLDSFFSGAMCVMSGGRLPVARFLVFLLDSKSAEVRRTFSDPLFFSRGASKAYVKPRQTRNVVPRLCVSKTKMTHLQGGGPSLSVGIRWGCHWGEILEIRAEMEKEVTRGTP